MRSVFFFVFFYWKGTVASIASGLLNHSTSCARERAGTGLSGVNKMNFSRLRVGGLATAPEMCVFCVKDFHWEKKKTQREGEKNVRGCSLVYRLCIDFSLSDTLIFHMERSALSLPAFCLCLNSVPHQHYQRLLKTKCLLCQQQNPLSSFSANPK